MRNPHAQTGLPNCIRRLNAHTENMLTTLGRLAILIQQEKKRRKKRSCLKLKLATFGSITSMPFGEQGNAPVGLSISRCLTGPRGTIMCMYIVSPMRQGPRHDLFRSVLLFLARSSSAFKSVYAAPFRARATQQAFLITDTIRDHETVAPGLGPFICTLIVIPDSGIIILCDRFILW